MWLFTSGQKASKILYFSTHFHICCFLNENYKKVNKPIIFYEPYFKISQFLPIWCFCSFFNFLMIVIENKISSFINLLISKWNNARTVRYNATFGYFDTIVNVCHQKIFDTNFDKLPFFTFIFKMLKWQRLTSLIFYNFHI